MTVTVKVLSAADGSPTPHDGRYVVRWNPHTEAGVLECDTTADITKAKRWEHAGEVLRERETVSNVERFRPWDGLPNRPLRGIAVTVENA